MEDPRLAVRTVEDPFPAAQLPGVVPDNERRVARGQFASAISRRGVARRRGAVHPEGLARRPKVRDRTKTRPISKSRPLSLLQIHGLEPTQLEVPLARHHEAAEEAQGHHRAHGAAVAVCVVPQDRAMHLVRQRRALNFLIACSRPHCRRDR